VLAESQALQSRFIAFTKGAVDGLLSIATGVWLDGCAQPLTTEVRRRIEDANADLAQNGMRVLGVAFKPMESYTDDGAHRNQLEQDLIFVGFFGIIDPPRAEVRDAVRTCKAAGIRPIMITGDHPLTARYIARDLGILEEETGVFDDGAVRPSVITGAELEEMDDERLGKVVEFVSVYARVSPEHKLRIVRALQHKEHIAAMTGDGVNDAPALKQADIGVAMGITGTDVSKEAADMVLRDDNFATIVAAVEEGRTIYDNVRRFVKFSVAGNIGKVLVMLLAPFLGMPIALLPLQLLWLNLLTDGLLGLGMGFEPAERDAMQRPPVSPRSGIFSGGLARHVAWVGALIGLLALGVGFIYWGQGHRSWQMMIFSTLAFAQIGQALASRANRESLFQIGLLSNKPLLGMVVLVAAAQVAVLVLPFLEAFFNTEPMGLLEWTISIGLGVVVFMAIEVEKWFIRRRAER
jgi:Ca2+-transporting ATPase